MNKKPENTPDIENQDALSAEQAADMPEETEAAAEAAQTAEAPLADEAAEETAAEEETTEEENAEEEAAADASEEEADKAETKPAKKKKFNSRKFKFGATATALTAAVVAAVVLLNVVVGILESRFPLNIDLTKDQTYSLSDASIEVLKGIDKEVKVAVFAEEKVFTQGAFSSSDLNTILRQYYEALNRAVSLSGNKVTVQYVDTSDPVAMTAYKDYDVESGDTLLLCGDRSQIIKISDLYEQSGDGYYSQITYTSLAERALVSKLSMVTREKITGMVFFTQHDESSSVMSALQDLYKLNGYEVSELNLSSQQEIAENVTTAVIAAPTKDYTDDEIKRLRDWLSNDGNLGRNLVVFTDYKADCPNLYKFLKTEYEITVTSNLVQETDYNNTYRTGLSYNPYYIYGTVASSDFTADLVEKPVVAGLNRQLLLGAGTDQEKESLTNHALLTFGESARLISLENALSEEEKTEDVLMKADEYPIVSVAYAHKWTYVDNKSVETNVLVSGSIELANSVLLSNGNLYNEELLLSTVNGMVGMEDTVQISGKSMTQTTTEFSATAAMVMLVVFQYVLPIGILVICLVVFLRRRHL